MSRQGEMWRSSNGSQSCGPWGNTGCASWRAYEIAAVVIGFFVFWPIGVALLMLKLFQKSFGYGGDMFDFARGEASRMKDAVGALDTRGFVPQSMRTTGNSAFDDWRRGELERLEEERRKLAQAERDFADHIDQLRRARDRDEFDSFMNARKGASE